MLDQQLVSLIENTAKIARKIALEEALKLYKENSILEAEKLIHQELNILKNRS
jgi:hypothetical protein